MTEDDHRNTGDGVRALVCLGMSQSFFEAEPEVQRELFGAIPQAFRNLGGRFGVQVLGTMDDDELMVGPSEGWPWTAYILVQAPDHASVTRICNIVRETEVAGGRLWRFMRIEARVGRPLFFGNE